MSTTTNIRNFVQSKVQGATDRIKPLEENTRRFFDATAERVRVSTPSSLKKLEANLREQLQVAVLTKKIEEALPSNIDINALSERLSNKDIKEKLSQALQSVFDRLNHGFKGVEAGGCAMALVASGEIPNLGTIL